MPWPPPKKPPVFDRSILSELSSKVFFYPCSGDDWIEPFDLFAPEIDEFWFVDIAYFPKKPDYEEPLLKSLPDYRLIDWQVRIPDIPETEWSKDLIYDFKPPYIRTETYIHQLSGHLVTIHRHKRRGPSALRKEIKHLGIFFYRGDGIGEGGSGTIWLSAAPFYHRAGRIPLIYEVLEKLVDGGLIVTDGSNPGYGDNPYQELCRFYGHGQSLHSSAMLLARPFTDLLGNQFRCIGYAGERYGPTLIWQVTKPK